MEGGQLTPKLTQYKLYFPLHHRQHFPVSGGLLPLKNASSSPLFLSFICLPVAGGQVHSILDLPPSAWTLVPRHGGRVHPQKCWSSLDFESNHADDVGCHISPSKIRCLSIKHTVTIHLNIPICKYTNWYYLDYFHKRFSLARPAI